MSSLFSFLIGKLSSLVTCRHFKKLVARFSLKSADVPPSDVTLESADTLSDDVKHLGIADFSSVESYLKFKKTYFEQQLCKVIIAGQRLGNPLLQIGQLLVLLSFVRHVKDFVCLDKRFYQDLTAVDTDWGVLMLK